MALGHFIVRGDKTSCGGTVLEGDSLVMMFGRPHSRAGDAVSCGQDGQTYRIIGGVDFIHSNGHPVAGILDSLSGCPCRARLLASQTGARYESTARAAMGASRAASAPPTPADVASAPPAARESMPPPAISRMTSPVPPQEPGFYVVPRSTTRQALIETLFPSPETAVIRKFMALNPDRDLVKAGTLIVLSDPNNHQCSREEALLMRAAAEVASAIESLSAEEADFMMQHRDEIETFLAHGSIAAGIGIAVYADNIASIKKTVQDIETLHQRFFQRDGHLRSPDFFAQRQQLMKELDVRMIRLTRKMINFPDHPNLKHALGLSSKSLVHRWNHAGATGQIPGYATHTNGIARISTILKYGGWVATGLGGAGSAMKVQDVCRADTDEACRKITFTETGSFSGGLLAGAATGSVLASYSGAKLCLGIGVVTGGVPGVLCAAVVVGAASGVAGYVGAKAGEQVGLLIHEVTR